MTGETRAPMGKAELVAVLRDIIAAIQADDSFGGSLEYEAAEAPGQFIVHAAYRVGNSDGQGGTRIIGGIA